MDHILLSTVSCKFPLFPFHWTSDDKGCQSTAAWSAPGHRERCEGTRRQRGRRGQPGEGPGGTRGAGEGEGEHRRGHMTRGGRERAGGQEMRHIANMEQEVKGEEMAITHNSIPHGRLMPI